MHSKARNYSCQAYTDLKMQLNYNNNIDATQKVTFRAGPPKAAFDLKVGAV